MRFADSRYERLPALAADLVARKVDVIVTLGTAATQAAQRATRQVPIVAMSLTDPIAPGFAESLAVPIGNVTGTTNRGSEAALKRLEIVASLVPKARRIGHFWNPENQGNEIGLGEIRKGIERLGLTVVSLPVKRPEDIERSAAIFQRERVDALNVSIDGFLTDRRDQLAKLALAHRLPSSGGTRLFVEAGGLMSYGASSDDHSRRAAAYIDRILNGAKPRDLPFQQTDKFDLFLNRKTAQVLGIVFPPTLLVRADLVIG